MRHILTLILFFLIGFTSKAQVFIPQSVTQTLGAPKLMNRLMDSNSKLDKFKNTTTLITYRTSDKYDLEQLKRIVKDIWTITPYKIIDIRSIDKYATNPEKYSVLSLQGYIIETSAYGQTSTSGCGANLNLQLYKLKDKARKQKLKSNTIAQVHLWEDCNCYEDLPKDLKSSKDITYRTPEFMTYNAPYKQWGLGFYKLYLKQMHDGLMQNNLPNHSTKTINLEELHHLSKAPLYLIEETLLTMKTYKADRSINLDKVFKDYDFEYKVIKDSELNEMLLKSETPVYFLYKNKVTWQVVDGVSGMVLFADTLVPELPASKIKALSKKIIQSQKSKAKNK